MNTSTIIGKLAELFAEKGEARSDCFYFTSCQLSVYPQNISQNEKVLSLLFRLSCPAWDRDLYETCTALGNDSEALSQALANFFLGIMEAVKQTLRVAGTPFCDCDCSDAIVEVESDLCGQKHVWKMAKSGVLLMGESPKDDVVDYWSIIRDDIIARMGNQKIYAVRIFVAKSGDNCTGECRINDVVIKGIGEKLKELARPWKSVTYGSHKQYFIFWQDDSTYIKYPNTFDDIRHGVRLAVDTLAEMKDDDDFYLLTERLELKGVEPILAEELTMFLPELCAEYAFNELNIMESLTFIMRNGEKVGVYMAQHSSYYPIQEALHDIIYNQQISQRVYEWFILQSSIYSAVLQVKEANSELSDCSVSLCFQPTEAYKLR